MHLTNAIITKISQIGIKPDQIVFDHFVPGFGVRFRRANGRLNSATFIFQYALSGGDRVQRRMVIGRCSALSTEQAREIAASFYVGVRQGRDPQGERFASRRTHKHLRVAEREVAALEQRISGLRRYVNARHD